MLRSEISHLKPFLLQTGSDKTNFSCSNYIFFNNLPCLYPRKVQDKSYEIRQLTNFDWFTEKMGTTKDIEYFSVEYLRRALDLPDLDIKIDNLYFNPKTASNIIRTDHTLIDETVKFVNENLSEQLFKGDSTKIRHGENNSGKLLTMTQLMDDEHYINLRQKQIDEQMKQNSTEYIYYSGLIKFKDYESKIRFLNTGAAYFGIKAHKNVLTTMCDADFINSLKIYSSEYLGGSPQKIVKDLNRVFESSESGIKLENSDFSHEKAYNILLENNIMIRFNSFLDTLRAKEILSNSKFLKSHVVLGKPKIKYYNGRFLSSFDMSVKNSVRNLENILEIRSDYATKKILKI